MGETSWGWCIKRDVLRSSVSCILLGKVVQVSSSSVHSATKSHLQLRDVLKSSFSSLRGVALQLSIA